MSLQRRVIGSPLLRETGQESWRDRWRTARVPLAFRRPCEFLFRFDNVRGAISTLSTARRRQPKPQRAHVEEGITRPWAEVVHMIIDRGCAQIGVGLPVVSVMPRCQGDGGGTRWCKQVGVSYLRPVEQTIN